MKIRNRIRELRHVKASELLPHPKNWRVHPEAQHNALRSVLAKIGYADVAIVRETPDGLQLLDGHLRAEEAGDGEIPVVVTDLDDAEAEHLLATLDPLAGMAEVDAEALASLLAEIEVESEELERYLLNLAIETKLDGTDAENKGHQRDAEPQVDNAARLQEKWKTAIGQLWIIPGAAGEHRLLCGDATESADVKRVMAGARAGLMNTDPPYGVRYENDERPNPGVAKPRVANDVLKDDELQGFLETVFRAAVDGAIVENAAWYLWHAHLTQGFFAAAAAAANVVLHRQIIWVKPVLLLGRGQYHWKHEPCFMGWVEGHQPPDYGAGNGERNQTTVWEIDGVPNKDRKEWNHSTPKPVELFRIPILKHLKPGEVCYEPFAGTGPQFVAADQLGRVCCGIEIEPKFVAVILERLKGIGLEPRLEKRPTAKPAGKRRTKPTKKAAGK